jgi:hypothetical protein
MKTLMTMNVSTAASVGPMKSAGKPHRGLRMMALMAACLGFNAALMATPVTVPDFSFEQTVFPAITNVITPGGTEGFNNGPLEGWWGTGDADVTETNGQGFAESYPTTYIQNADTNSGSLFPTNSDGTLIAPADGTNYAVLGGSGDLNIWDWIFLMASFRPTVPAAMAAVPPYWRWSVALKFMTSFPLVPLSPPSRWRTPTTHLGYGPIMFWSLPTAIKPAVI